jgi:hypothetical protein
LLLPGPTLERTKRLIRSEPAALIAERTIYYLRKMITLLKRQTKGDYPTNRDLRNIVRENQEYLRANTLRTLGISIGNKCIRNQSTQV